MAKSLRSSLGFCASGLLASFSLALALAGCGGDSSTPGTPGTAGTTGGAGRGGSSGGTGGGTGGTATAGTSGGGGAAGSGSAGTSGGGGSAGGAAGSSGGATAGSGGGSAGAAGGSGGGAAGAGRGGGDGGVAGAAGGSAGGDGGVAGASGGAAGGTSGGAGRGGSGGGAAGAAGGTGGGAAGTGGAGGSAGGAGGQGGGSTAGCPANATFCSGFEQTALPTGAVYKVNAAPGDWTRDFAVDTSVRKNGNSSLRVKPTTDTGSSGSAYRMLAVPATQGAFWVRFHVRSDLDMGGEHNAFAIASGTDEPNDNANSVEFAEDVGIAFNSNDDVRWPTGYGRLPAGGTNPYVLAKNTWHCVEVSFDGTNRVQQLFVNGTQLINATSYPSATKAFRWFKFGFNSLHGPNRQMWYDDVAVAPTRIGGCS